MCSNIPSAIFYGSVLSEFLRIARCTLLFEDFIPKANQQTSIFHSNSNSEVLNSEFSTELINVSDWLIANKLSLNISKSNFVTFSTRQKAVKKSLYIKILNIPLEEKKSTKYLGVIVDQHLNWSSHIEYIHQKITKGVGMLAKLRHYVPLNNLRQIYFALVQSHINYAILNWGFATPTNLKNIDISMKKCARVMLFKFKNEHSAPLFNTLKLLNFKINFKLKLAQFLWLTKNENLPGCTQHFFNISHNVLTRQDFILPFPRTNHKRSSIFF